MHSGRFNKILITGGAGFIGSHLARRLVSDGHEVTVADNLSTGYMENVPDGASFINVDLGEKESYVAFDGLSFDAILHLAGQSSGELSFNDPFLDLKSHVMSTFWMLDWCRKNGVKRFLYASSMAVYGDPVYQPVDEKHPIQPKMFYSAGKAAAETYIRLYQTLGIETTVFRLFSVYGPGQNLANKSQGMASIFLSYMLENAPILVKGPQDRFRDFIYVDDVVDAWILALENPVSHGKTYNLATGRKTTVGELLTTLTSCFEKKRHPVQFSGGTPGDQSGVVADIEFIKKDLGFEPKIGLQKGINEMVVFEKQRADMGGAI